MLRRRDRIYILVLISTLIMCIFILMIVGNGRCDSSERFKSKGKRVLIIIAGNYISEKDMKQLEKMKNIKYDIVEFQAPLDISPSGWNELVKIISGTYPNYDAFVVVHSPETLTYTASAMSFLLENLAKTVVFTYESFLPAIKLAASYCIPEVVVCHGANILRACRTKKIKNSYISPNYPTLGRVLSKVKIDEDAVMSHSQGNFSPMFIDPNRQIAVIKIYPGIDDTYIRNVIKSGRIYGIVLESYHSRHIPMNKKIIELIHSMVRQAGIMIVNVSQDLGTVTDQSLEHAGVISCSDMTTEAAMSKLHMIISNVPKYNQKMVSQLMNMNMRGEI